MFSKVRENVRWKNNNQLPSDFSLATSDIESYKLECLPVAELNYCHPKVSTHLHVH